MLVFSCSQQVTFSSTHFSTPGGTHVPDYTPKICLDFQFSVKPRSVVSARRSVVSAGRSAISAERRLRRLASAIFSVSAYFNFKLYSLFCVSALKLSSKVCKLPSAKHILSYAKYCSVVCVVSLSSATSVLSSPLWAAYFSRLRVLASLQVILSSVSA